MSNDERTFIRQLKITLISVLGPFMLLTIGSMINDHFKIKNNMNHINALEQKVVSREIMLLYINELRNLTQAVEKDMEDHCVETTQEIKDINNRIDKLMRDIYEVKKRGATISDNL